MQEIVTWVLGRIFKNLELKLEGLEGSLSALNLIPPLRIVVDDNHEKSLRIHFSFVFRHQTNHFNKIKQIITDDCTAPSGNLPSLTELWYDFEAFVV